MAKTLFFLRGSKKSFVAGSNFFFVMVQNQFFGGVQKNFLFSPKKKNLQGLSNLVAELIFFLCGENFFGGGPKQIVVGW